MLKLSDLMKTFRQDPPLLHRRLAQLSQEDKSTLLKNWPFWARPEQLAPHGSWSHWLVLAGRGFGKTRTGAEWVRHMVETGAAKRVALVAPTAADAREVMIEGESGLLAVARHDFRPLFEPSKRRLTWPNGAIATAYSADEPERLRGPQHDLAWCDELCAWRRAEEAFDMLMFGLRLGTHPRTCITTTPKPTHLLKALMTNPAVTITKGRTYDNLANLAPTFRSEILTRYEGTRLGRQELDAEILEDMAGALWSRAMIEATRGPAPSDFDRIVVALDPPATSTGDECGIIAAGRARGRVYILADESAAGLSPRGWATKAIDLYHRLDADRIIAEVNQGGDMIESLLRQEDPGIAYQAVHATRGKVTRAEPVAALYEQRRVVHTRSFKTLEDQMCAFSSNFDRSLMGYSPDRVDALVWAVSALMQKQASTQIRRL